MTIRVGEVLRKDQGVVSIDVNASLEDAQEILSSARVARLPVVSNGGVVGSLSQAEVLLYLELEKSGLAVGSLNQAISPRDCMFDGNRVTYIADGLMALSGIRRGQEAAGIREPGSILDFGCGHGRVLRMLQVAYLSTTLIGCDTDLDGVNFCESALGVRCFVSHADPGQINFDGQFDLIWAGSVLTHVPSDRWPSYLEWFESHITPGGALIFTIQGEHAAEALRRGEFRLFGVGPMQTVSLLDQFDEHQFGYTDYPDQDGYGVSLSSAAWVRGLVQDQTAMEIVDFSKGGFGEQDVLTLRSGVKSTRG